MSPDNDGRDFYALFSTQDKAGEWADMQERACLITPYIVDEPMYGESRSN